MSSEICVSARFSPVGLENLEVVTVKSWLNNSVESA